MAIDLLVEKLIAEIKAVKKADSSLPNEPQPGAAEQGPAFVKTASAAEAAEEEALQQIAMLDERHAEEIVAEELAEAQADDKDDDEKEEDEVHHDDNGDQAIEDAGDGVVDETFDIALAETEAGSAEAASNGQQTANSVLSVSEGGQSGGWSAPGWLAPVGALGAAAIGGGVAAASSGSSSNDDAPPPVPPVTPAGTIVSGTVMMGPVTRGLSVNVYDDQGNLLGSGEVGENSQYSVDVGDYSGMVLVRLADENGTEGNYMDEALGAEQDLTVELRAMTVVSGGEVVLNVTPLTELAVRELGLEATDDINLSGITATEEQVEAVNLAISRLFLGEGAPSIERADIAPVIDRDGNDTTDGSNTYGQVLAALSGADASETIAGGLGMERTIAALSDAITDAFTGSGVTWIDQEDEGVAARAIVQFGLEIANDNPNLTIDEEAFFADAGIEIDKDAPVVTELTLSVDENTTAVGVLSAQDLSGIDAWALVAGEGADNNDLFTLSPDGTLALNNPEDFENTTAPFSIRVSVADKLGNATEAIITVNVADVNEAPVSTALEDQFSIISQDFSFDVSDAFSDVDSGDVLTFSAQGLPEGYVIDSATGVISGQASAGGDATVTVTATDSGGLTVSETFTISVFTAPTVLSIEGDGTTFFNENSDMRLALKLSEPVTVMIPEDSPTLTLNFNGVEVIASFAEQDSEDGSILYFEALGPAGDGNALSITSIDLDGATFIGDISGENLDTDFTGLTFDAVTIDNTAPTLEISADRDLILKGETTTVTFTFSEEPMGFVEGGVTVAGGTLFGFQVSPENPAIYTAVFTPDPDAEGTASIEVSAYQDRAGNTGQAPTPLDVVYDTLTASVTDIDLQLNLAQPTVTVTFDDTPADFTIDDIIVTGGALSNLRLADAGDPLIYVADFTEQAGFNGTFSASVASGTFSDESGNPGEGAGTPVFSINVPSSTGFINKDQLVDFTASGMATEDAAISYIVVRKDNPLIQTNIRTGTVLGGGFWSGLTDLTQFISENGDGTYFIQGTTVLDDKSVIGLVSGDFIIDTAVEAPALVSPPDLIEAADFDASDEMTLAFTAQDDIVKLEVIWQGSDLARDAEFNQAAGQWEVAFTRNELAALGDGPASFVAYATDRAGNRAPEDASAPVNVTIELDNQAPQATGEAIPELIVLTGSDSTTPVILDLTDLNGDGEATTNDVAFTDADAPGSENASLTYSGVDLPAWLEVTSEGLIRIADGQTAPSTAEPVTITVRASDGTASVDETIEINLISAPTVTAIAPVGGAASVQQGAVLEFNVTMSEAVAVDTAGGAPILDLSVGGVPFTATYDAAGSSGNTLRFRATAPLANGSGVSIEAINLGGATVIGDLSGQSWATDVVGQTAASITVDNVGPIIDAQALDVDENETAVGVLQATDNFDDDVEWAFATGLGFDADNALFNLAADGTLTLIAAKDFESDTKNYTLHVQATDDAGNTTDQLVTVALNDVNEAPEAASQTFGPQPVIVDSDAGTVIANLTDIGGVPVFTDPDGEMTAFGTLTYEGVGLPAWLEVTPEGVIQVKAGNTAPSSAADLAITVRATDGGGLSVQKTIDISVVSAPTLTTMMNDVNNLDVRSDLVMTASENVALTTVDGTYDITIRNNGGPGYRTENNDNTQTIRIVVSGSAVSSVRTLNGADPESPDYIEDHGVNISDLLTINGDQVRINPHFDLDLGNDYHVDVDGGLFVGADSGQGNVAFDGSTEGDFSTVDPEAATSVAAAEQAQWFDASGALVNSAQWVSVDATGVASDLNPTQIGSIGSGAYVIVFKDWDLDGGGVEREGDDNLADDGLIADGVRSNGFNVHVLDFGTDDLIYIDDQHNNGVVNAPNAGEVADVGGQDGLPAGTTRVTRDGVTGRGQGLLNLSPDAGLNFSSALLVDLDSGDVAAGENWSDLLNGRGESPIIGG